MSATREEPVMASPATSASITAAAAGSVEAPKASACHDAAFASSSSAVPIKKKVLHLVIDSGAIIKGANVTELAEVPLLLVL